MEINGVAHIVLRVRAFEECVAFYDALLPRLGLQAVYRSDSYVYYVGGRTAIGLRRPASELAGHAHEELAPGIDHLCFRARRRADIDELYAFLGAIGAGLVPGAHGPFSGAGLLLALVPRSRGDPPGDQPRSPAKAYSPRTHPFAPSQPSRRRAWQADRLATVPRADPATRVCAANGAQTCSRIYGLGLLRRARLRFHKGSPEDELFPAHLGSDCPGPGVDGLTFV